MDQHYGGGSHVSGPPSVASSIVDHQHHIHQGCDSMIRVIEVFVFPPMWTYFLTRFLMTYQCFSVLYFKNGALVGQVEFEIQGPNRGCLSARLGETLILTQISGPPSVTNTLDHVPTGGGGGGGGGLMPSSSLATMDHLSNPPSVASTGLADHHISGPSSVTTANVEHASGPPSVSSVDHMSVAAQGSDRHSVNFFTYQFSSRGFSFGSTLKDSSET